MSLFLSRHRERDPFSAALAAAIRAFGQDRPADAPGRVIGLEHEFRVLLAGRAIDFGAVIHRLPVEGRRIDPADPNAYRCAWGGTLTSDGDEAEIAIPPVELAHGFAGTVASRAAVGRARLEAILPEDAVIEGYSTHLSVEVPDRLVERVARLYVETFAPALMLLLDGPGSPGLLIRPRPGRLELCGEFADGERLHAAAAFVAGSVRTVVRAAGRWPLWNRGLPSEIAVRPEPARERYGWFLPPEGVVSGLYRGGRLSRLPLRRGGTVSAQQHLERCWAIARAALSTIAGPDDLASMDRICAGTEPLGVELQQVMAVRLADGPAPTDSPVTAFGELVRERRRGELRVSPEIVAWDFAVLRVSAGMRSIFACLPRPVLAPALAALDAGHLDAALLGFLAAPRAGRMLATPRQTTSPALYDTISTPAALLAPERPPIGELSERPGKRRRDDSDHRDQQPNQESGAQGAIPATPHAATAGLRVLGLSAPIPTVLAASVLALLVGATMLLNRGGAASVVVPVSTPTGAALAVIGASPAQATMTTVAPSPSAPTSGVADASPFTGTYDLTWVFSSVELAPGFAAAFSTSNQPAPPSPADTGAHRVKVSCTPTSCTIAAVTPPALSPVERQFGFLTFPSLDWKASGLSRTLTFPTRSCGPSAMTIAVRVAGTNPESVDGQTVYGGFEGTLVDAFTNLKGSDPTGHPCYFFGYHLRFTATRVTP